MPARKRPLSGPPPEKKTERMGLRLTKPEYDALFSYADRIGTTPSELVREAVASMVEAAKITGPALQDVAEGTIEEQRAALEALRVQAEQFEVLGRQYKANYVAALQKLVERQSAGVQAAS